MDRAELKKCVLDNISFRAALEAAPEVRELISDFYASRYPACLTCLEGKNPKP
jgi:hypothetical protein